MDESAENSPAITIVNKLLSHHRNNQNDALHGILKAFSGGLVATEFKIGPLKRILRIISYMFSTDLDNGSIRSNCLRSVILEFSKVNEFNFAEEMPIVLQELSDNVALSSSNNTRKLLELCLLSVINGDALNTNLS